MGAEFCPRDGIDTAMAIFCGDKTGIWKRVDGKSGESEMLESGGIVADAKLIGEVVTGDGVKGSNGEDKSESGE